MLETAGYTVDLARDGAEALAALRSDRYDLVLMDIQMDGMDGIAATKAIRRMDDWAKQIPIIAMTANVLSHDVKSFQAAGMNDHLGKPFKRKQLLEKVRQWLPTDTSTRTDGHKHESEPLQRVPDLVEVPKTIDDLYSTLGREWVGKGLTELVDQLQIIVKELGAEDRAGLARRAHMLVSRAGMFGFSELAELCGQLEQATKRGQPLEPYMARLQTLGQAAQSVVLQILQKHNTNLPHFS